MKDEDSIKIWKTANMQNKIDVETLIYKIENKKNSFENKIKSRNYLEIIAAVFVNLIFGYKLTVVDSIVSKIGCIVILLSSYLIVYKLLNTRTAAKKINTSILESLENHLVYVKNEAKLLKTVLWWYILPINIGVLLLIIGDSDNLFIIALVTVILLIGGIIVKKVNKKALKTEVQPKIKEIEKEIEKLKKIK